MLVLSTKNEAYAPTVLRTPARSFLLCGGALDAGAPKREGTESLRVELDNARQ